MRHQDGNNPSKVLYCVLLVLICVHAAYTQSQALDAQIDGIVADTNGSIVRAVSITAINVQTGAKRSGSTNEDGIFRFPILSLGLYTIVAESPGFKRFERRGIMLSAGQTASITILLEPGRPEETVTVTSDAAIADASKFEIGHLVNSREVKNLPLISRNPYNFILLQPAVNGRTVGNPLVIDLSANGLRRRVGYNIDGNYNNNANQSGFRLNTISETFVKEVQLLSNGYSAEFGNTAGAVVNVITPSGTNDLDGAVTFLYRPSLLSSKPFGFTLGESEPNIGAYGLTAAIGGPVIRGRWHFYTGYEWTRRNTTSPITITDENRNALIATGLPASIFLNSKVTSDNLPYFIFRTDAKLSGGTRASFRYNRFDAGLRNSFTGGLSTTQRSLDRIGYDHAFAAQAVTSFSETFFNEFRFQYARSILPLVSNKQSASGVSISIDSVANLGPNPLLGTIALNESVFQLQNAVTKIFDDHSVKLGGGIIFIRDRPKSEVSARYRFPSIQSYSDAVNGIDRRSYTQYVETFGDSEISYQSTFLNFFIQDDWRLTRRLRLAVGLRYELYHPPTADPDSPLPYSRKFSVDTNNFAPRLGLVYLLRDGKYRTVVRFGSGIHYDPPILAMYRRAILNNGNPRYFSFSFSPGDAVAPVFPNTLGTFPPGAMIPRRNIDAVAPDFKTMYAVHSNVQVEQTISDNMSITAGFIYSIARHIPVYRNINCRPVGGTLADGRPIYGTFSLSPSGRVTLNACTNPVVPQFNLIKLAESVGNLNSRALFVQLTKRFSNGFQFSSNYTLSRARDDAPEENGRGSVTLSDPSNRKTDSGNAYGDVSQVFNLSIIARPRFRTASRLFDALLNDNQIGLIAIADSGENFDISAGSDLNRDGVLGSDRPVGVARNSGRLPAYLGVDARYSRFFKLSEKLSFEFYAEATNVFNSKQVSFYEGTSLSSNNIFTSLVNPLTGELRGPLPDFRNLLPNWRDSRQLQFGAKIHF